MNTNIPVELLAFFKALSDANRLKILGLLAQESYSVEELAELLALRPSTVSHHLARLAEVGLVTARPVSYYNVYNLETGALEAMARRLLSEDALPAMAENINLDAYDQKVIKDYSMTDGRLKDIPSQRKKRDAVLRHIVKSFEPDVTYTEKEVNGILSRFHPDTATLRRELIGYPLMVRDRAGQEYRRINPTNT